MGKNEGESCVETYECEVGLSCTPDITFPFATSCKKLLSKGALCQTSTDCELDHVCLPASPSDVAAKNYTCQPIFSRKEGEMIGYISDASKTPI